MPEAPMPPRGQPGNPDAAGDNADPGGMEAAVNQIGQGLEQLAGAEPAFQAVFESFKQAVSQLQGGGADGATTPEQGASGAQPMSMQRPQ